MVKPPYECLKNGDISTWNQWKKDHQDVAIKLKNVEFIGGSLAKADLQFADLEGANFLKADLREANLHEAYLKDAYLHESHLEGAILCHAELDGANLRCIWMDTNTDCTETLFSTSSFSINEECSISEEALINILSVAYVNNIQFLDPVLGRKVRDASWLYHFKLECQRSWWKKFLFRLWGITCNYGRNIWKWAVTSIVISIVFAAIYSPVPDFAPRFYKEICYKIGPQFEQTPTKYKKENADFFSMLYFSIVTFTTLGFGDVVAANTMARFLVTIEVIIGYVMLGGLISIFANILARRSD